MSKIIVLIITKILIFGINLSASDNISYPNDNMSMPNAFSSGSIISSNQINKNFDYLLDMIKINTLLFYVDNVSVGFARPELGSSYYKVVLLPSKKIFRINSQGNIQTNTNVNFLPDNMTNVYEDCSNYQNSTQLMSAFYEFCQWQYIQRYFDNPSC